MEIFQIFNWVEKFGILVNFEFYIGIILCLTDNSLKPNDFNMEISMMPNMSL